MVDVGVARGIGVGSGAAATAVGAGDVAGAATAVGEGAASSATRALVAPAATAHAVEAAARELVVVGSETRPIRTRLPPICTELVLFGM
jgi:hypothetical protein